MEELQRLKDILTDMGRVAVAFSGGTDSTLLLRLARDWLGAEHVLALTAVSPSQPAVERAEAEAMARRIGVRHLLIETPELADADYAANPPERCYICKRIILEHLIRRAKNEGFRDVVDGSNADDLSDYRPGLKAAAERAVRAPLAEAGLTKADIRALAAALGLSIHEKPASPCLSSRVPYGEAVTPEKLARIDAAETFLRSLGFRECRVRHHADLARIEVPAGEVARLAAPELRTRVDAHLRELGFRYVALDLRGFRSGSLNEVLLGTGLTGR